jgi:beta-lactamase superfamily II metal-dependent hydrolase
VFLVTSIQAGFGDSILVSYGPSHGQCRHILVDGGTESSLEKLFSTLEKQRVNGRLRLEALVVTHFDLDHIGGIIALLKARPSWLEIGDIWFNGRKHLIPSDVLGPDEGDELTALIQGYYAWNAAFGGAAIRSDLPPITLPGGLRVWIVSPDQRNLTRLATVWPVIEGEAAAQADRLGARDSWPPGSFGSYASRPFSRDSSIANGSSIALILEYEGKVVLLAGDAYPDVVRNGIMSHWNNITLRVDLLKLSHHGSKRNTSEELLKAVECDNYIFSTSTEKFKHPDFDLIARILKIRKNPNFIFNYAVERTLWWRSVPEGWPTFRSQYPVGTEGFVRIEC